MWACVRVAVRPCGRACMCLYIYICVCLQKDIIHFRTRTGICCLSSSSIKASNLSVMGSAVLPDVVNCRIRHTSNLNCL
jgi:hypothetical protein